MAGLRDRFSHDRFVWLDQARGVVGLLFIISYCTWHFRGDLLRGDSVIAPPHLDHGYNYLRSFPPMVTIIDAGQSVFIYFVGISAYIAFSGRLERQGRRGAWRYGGIRVGLLYLLAIAGELRRHAPASDDVTWLDNLKFFDWYRVLFTGVLATIAAAGLATYLAVTLLPQARHRFRLAVSIWIIYAIVFAMYLVDRDTAMDFMLDRPKFPMMTISLAALAIFGSCFGQWMQEGREDLNTVMKRFVVPISLWCVAASYCLEWAQPSDHHEATPALMLLAAGLSGLLIATQYALYQIGITAPVLHALGRNLLVVFLVAAIGCPLYLSALPEQLVYDDPLFRMILVGMVPPAAITLLALWLDHRKIAVRV